MLDCTYTPDGGAIVTDDDAPDVRYIVWQDTDAEDPRGWDDDAQTIIYNAPRGAREDVCESVGETPTMRAYLRRYELTGDDADALHFARRFARTFDPTHTIATASARGYSQSHWADIVTVCPADNEPNAYLQEFAQWFAGDVYGVMLETRTPCETPDDAAHWQPITDTGADAIACGGIYADDAIGAVAQYVGMV